MRKATMKIRISDGKAISAKVLPDGSCEVAIELDMLKVSGNNVEVSIESEEGKGICISPTVKKPDLQVVENGEKVIRFEEIKRSQCVGNEAKFILIEASKFTADDPIFDYEPKTGHEKWVKEQLLRVAQSKIPDFYRPNCDPSINANGGIMYAFGEEPAVGLSYRWWTEAANNFMPERGSRIGTIEEYGAFLIVLMKRMLEEKWSIESIWKKVCNDSSTIGHYRTSPDARYRLEGTGSRAFCGFCDLGNVSKIVAENKATALNPNSGHILCGGSYNMDGARADLARAYAKTSNYANFTGDFSVGWVVLEK